MACEDCSIYNEFIQKREEGGYNRPYLDWFITELQKGIIKDQASSERSYDAHVKRACNNCPNCEWGKNNQSQEERCLNTVAKTSQRERLEKEKVRLEKEKERLEKEKDRHAVEEEATEDKYNPRKTIAPYGKTIIGIRHEGLDVRPAGVGKRKRKHTKKSNKSKKRKHTKKRKKSKKSKKSKK